MNEFETVQKTTNKIFEVLNEAHLSGMTIYYMLGDIQRMVKDQIQNPVQRPQGETKNDNNAEV